MIVFISDFQIQKKKITWHNDLKSANRKRTFKKWNFYGIHILEKRKRQDSRTWSQGDLSESNDYKGCDLKFNRADCEASGRPDPETIRQKGTLLVFPSFVRHSVTPITDGTRHALVGWVVGPTWR